MRGLQELSLKLVFSVEIWGCEMKRYVVRVDRGDGTMWRLVSSRSFLGWLNTDHLAMDATKWNHHGHLYFLMEDFELSLVYARQYKGRVVEVADSKEKLMSTTTL